MDISDLMKILDKLSGMDVLEASVELDSAKVMVKHHPRINDTPAPQTHMRAAVAPDTIKELETEGRAAVKSPIAGIFYSASSPEQPPFVTAGQAVKKGDILCILETMKLFNELKAETDGKIVKILAENEQQVEARQVLFIIEET